MGMILSLAACGRTSSSQAASTAAPAPVSASTAEAVKGTGEVSGGMDGLLGGGGSASSSSSASAESQKETAAPKQETATAQAPATEKQTAAATAAPETKAAETKAAEQQTSKAGLAVPAIRDLMDRDSSTENHELFTDWAPVEGADGYEICQESKYHGEESYREPEYKETTTCFFIVSAQDDFDFRLKVRAYQGSGSSRVYSDWSRTVEGSILYTAEGAETQPQEDQSSQGWQNPTMNFIGNYASGRCNIVVSATGKSDAAFYITWSSSAAEHSEWQMSGTLDLDTLAVHYSNCVKKDVVFKEDGSVEEETVVYENGSGIMQFKDSPIAVIWTDDQEDVASGIVFDYVY